MHTLLNTWVDLDRRDNAPPREIYWTEKVCVVLWDPLKSSWPMPGDEPDPWRWELTTIEHSDEASYVAQRIIGGGFRCESRQAAREEALRLAQHWVFQVQADLRKPTPKQGRADAQD